MPDPIPTSTAPQTALVVPEVPSAASSAPNVTVVDVPVSPAVSKTATKDKMAMPGIQTPKEALGDDSAEEMDRMEQKMVKESGGKLAGRPRDEKGRLIPSGKPKETIQPQPDKKPVAKVEAKAPAQAEPPAKVEAVAPQKIKIGDEELTSDEIVARMKELKDAQTKAVLPKEPAKVEAEQPPDVAQQRAKFITDKFKEVFTPEKIKAMDKAMSEGDYAEVFRPVVEMMLERYESVLDNVKPILAELRKTVDPLDRQRQQIEQYQTETQFLNDNPSIKSNPKGLETYRSIADRMHAGYSQIQQKIAQGTASPQEQLWAQAYDQQTPEQMASTIAAHTKAELATAMPVDTAPPAKVEAKPQPQAKPFNGERPGGVSRVATESSDARALREMNERQGI